MTVGQEMKQISRLLMFALLTAVVVSIAASASASDKHDLPVLERAHELYNAAMDIRFTPNPSWKEQIKCVEEFLMPAADLRRIPHGHATAGQQQANDSTISDTAAGTALDGFPGLAVGPNAHAGALRELGLTLMEGFGCDVDAQLALQLLRKASELGDPAAQAQMGFRYALGLQYLDSWDADGIVHFGEPDEAAALTHLYFAAAGHDPAAQMALGDAHMHGINVPKSCQTAASYYLPVAEQVSHVAASSDGPGLPHVERLRLSVHYLHGSKAERQKEVIQYYQDSADKGNVDAQTAVGQVLNYGTHGVERDHAAAMSYLQKAADAGDAAAMAHLGHMLANGLDGKPADFEAARKYFADAAKQGSASAQYGLGYMHLIGQGVDVDYDKAFSLFNEAAAQGHIDAHFYLGVMHLRGLGVKRKSMHKAFTHFTVAATPPWPHSPPGNVQAMYNAALLHLGGKGTPKSCRPAASLLKLAAERGPAGAVLQYGHEAFFRGHYRRALWQYLMAAMMGMELGQSNAAWLLEQGYVRAGGLVHNVSYALHQRSAAQGNVASLLAMGDAYFYGEGVCQDWARASAIYYEAYQERSAEAMFNLGFMHEFGAGVPKDLSLASRFYNMASHTSSEAMLAVWCARTWLILHKAWDVIRPYLPQAYDHIWNNIWALNPPHTSVLGSWTAVVASLLPSQTVVQLELGAWQWADALGITSLAAAFADSRDLGETAMLVFLIVLLYVVLRVRRRRVERGRVPQVPGAAQPPAPVLEQAAVTAAFVPDASVNHGTTLPEQPQPQQGYVVPGDSANQGSPSLGHMMQGRVEHNMEVNGTSTSQGNSMQAVQGSSSRQGNEGMQEVVDQSSSSRKVDGEIQNEGG